MSGSPRGRYTPIIQTWQPDGSLLIRAGEPVTLPECVGVPKAARLLELSQRRVLALIDEGRLAEAFQPGGPRGRWFIPLPTIEAYKRRC